MRSDWITCKISELAEVIGGGTPSTKNEDYYGGEISWITPKDLSGYTNQYISEGERSITKLGLEKSSAKLMPAGSILFSSRAPIGYVAIAAKPLSTNQGFKSLVPNKEKLDSLFGYYLMKFYAPEIERHASGSTFKEVSGTVVKNFEIKVPKSIDTQRKVASILASLDNKIANNKAMNQTLEKLAQRIFKSWFIDFDPVKANKEGLPFDGLSPEIQALFPSEFEDSELGMIPKGWEVTPLSKVVKLTGGGTPKRSEASYWNGEIPWFSMKDAPENGEVFVIDTEEKITELGLQKSSTKLLPRGTTIITARGTVGKLALVATDMCMNQSCYGVRGTEVGDYFNYFNIKQAISTLKQNVHGAVFDTITTNTFDTYSFAFSGSEIANAYNELIAPLLEKSEINSRQNITLTRLRDRLLPKLVSGQISVGEAAQELAEAI